MLSRNGISLGSPTKSSVSSSRPSAASSSSSSPSGSGSIIKIRAGGSGTSVLAMKQKQELPSNGRMPLGKQPAAAPQAKPATAHRIVIPAKQSQAAQPTQPKANPNPAAGTTAAAAQATTAKPASTTSPATSSSSSSSSSIPTPRSHPSKSSHISSSYISPTSYDYPSEGGSSATETPNGIRLDLSSNPVPQLVAIKSRSDRLRQACMNEDKLEVVNLLGQGTDPNQVDAYGNTALMLAASTGNVDVVEELLAHGANVQAKDKYGQTSLIFACSKGHYEVAKMLVERKAGVNVATMHGQTALMKVCYISHPHTGILAELLLTHHAKPDLATADGTTAAHIAVEQDHLELLEILAHYGADMSKPKTTPPGDTPLHLAARKASFTMIANLIALGADVEAKNLEGKTVREITPSPAPGTNRVMPLPEFQRKLAKALDRGLLLKEQRRKEQEENTAIIERVKKEKEERLRAAMVAEKRAEGLSLLEAHSVVAQALGSEGERKAYIDEDGNEHYSRPSSAKLSYEELKERTYKPKIDPKSVFGEDEDSTIKTTTTTQQNSQGAAASSSSYFYSSASSKPPASYNKALQDDDEQPDSEDEMKMVGDYGR